MMGDEPSGEEDKRREMDTWTTLPWATLSWTPTSDHLHSSQWESLTVTVAHEL